MLDPILFWMMNKISEQQKVITVQHQEIHFRTKYAVIVLSMVIVTNAVLLGLLVSVLNK